MKSKEISFISLIKNPFEFCKFENGTIVAANAVLSAGCLITEDQKAAFPIGPLDVVAPDEPTASLDDSVKKAFDLVKPLLKNKHSRRALQSAFLSGGTVTGSTGRIVIEAKHSSSIAIDCLVPCDFLNFVCSAKKKLKAYGYSENSLTFWYDDLSFVRTKLTKEKVINFQKTLASEVGEEVKLPYDFYTLLKDKKIKEITLPSGLYFYCVDVAYLKKVKCQFYLTDNKNLLVLKNEICRGAIIVND